MPFSAVTIPENFQAELDAQLLAQPEPQYFYAQLVKAALNISLGGDMPDMMNFSGMEVGAAYTDVQRDRLLLEAKPLATETFAAKINFQGRRGDIIRINRPKYTDSTYTLASRRIAPGQTISTTAINIGSEQTEIQLHRLGGPYSTEVQPYAIEAFDSQMGVHSGVSVTKVHLQRDFDKTVDTIVRDCLDDASAAVYPDGMTAVNDATSSGQFPLTYNQITRVAKRMDEASLPRYSTGRRGLVVTPTGKRQLKDDPQFARHADYHRDKNVLFPGWFATCDEFDMFCSNTLYEADNTSSVEIHYGHAIAPGVLGVGMGRKPTVRASTDTNYGELLRLIWLGDLGFKLFDNRFVVSVRYSEDEDAS
jgi:hypothetical protein